MREDRTPRVVELERRARPREHDVRVVERYDCSDVRPVAAEEIRAHAVLAEGVRDNLPPEIGGAVLFDRLEQDLA